MENLWKEVLLVGTEMAQHVDVREKNWDFSSLKEAFEPGAVLHKKTCWLYGSTERGYSQVLEKAFLIPVIFAVVSPLAPSNKLVVKSVAMEDEQIIDMEAMKIDWSPYFDVESARRKAAERSEVSVLKCKQRRTTRTYLKRKRGEDAKKIEYFFPYFFKPKKEGDPPAESVVPISYISDEPQAHCKDQANAAKAKIREAKIERNKFIDSMTAAERESFRVMKLYKFYPKDSEVLKLQLEHVNRFFGNTDEVFPPLLLEVDLSRGAREFLTEKRAEELLQRLFTSSITKVCLSSKIFGPEAAAVAAKAFENVKASLTEVDLSDTIAGLEENKALAALATISKALMGTKLLAINLSDNALGEKGIRSCADALQGQTALQQLSICNAGISKDAAIAIVETMPDMPDLRLFHFHQDLIEDDGAKMLAKIVAKSKKLENFRFSSTRLKPEGGLALAEALMSGSNLKSLDLYDNMFNEEIGQALARTLQCHSSLRELYLSYTGVGDKGAIALAVALKKDNTVVSLEVLELRGNEITEKATKSLGSLIETNQGLRKIDLGENRLRDKGVAFVCLSISPQHRKLEELHLSQNKCTTVGAIAAASAVAYLPAFKLVDLNENYISSDAIKLLKSILEKGSVGVHVLGPLDENNGQELPMEEDEDEDEVHKVREEIRDLKLST